MTRQDDNFKKCMMKLDKINKDIDDMKGKILVGDIFIWIAPFFATVCLFFAFISWVTS